MSLNINFSAFVHQVDVVFFIYFSLRGFCIQILRGVNRVVNCVLVVISVHDARFLYL